MNIHPTAIISPSAIIKDQCIIGPYCVIEEGVVLGEGSQLGPRVHVVKGTEIGKEAKIYDGAVIGSDPQDLKYDGRDTYLKIGDRVKIREYCTVNRGTKTDIPTLIGDDVLLMAYTHVAHDCVIENQVVLANGVQLGGHVRLGERCVIGGNTAVHQFSEVGAMSFIGGTLKIDRHVPPFSKALGNPLRWAGLNSIGIERGGLKNSLEEIKSFYKSLQRESLNSAEIIKRTEAVTDLYTQKILKDFFSRSKENCLSVKRDLR